VGTASISSLLAEWRAAERRWERHGSADEVRLAAEAVVRAWVAYQDAAIPHDSGEFMLVAGDDQSYIAATAGITKVLGYDAGDLIGLRIEDLAAPELRETTPGQWAQFLADGRQDGRFRIRAKDGRLVSLQYQARAHHPVPGFHMSRLWQDVGQA
jgi:PAS domain S-box-containing protein